MDKDGYCALILDGEGPDTVPAITCHGAKMKSSQAMQTPFDAQISLEAQPLTGIIHILIVWVGHANYSNPLNIYHSKVF